MTNESIAVWQEKLLPLLSALREHTTTDQIARLRDEAMRHDDPTPSEVLDVIDTCYRLRIKVEKL